MANRGVDWVHPFRVTRRACLLSLLLALYLALDFADPCVPGLLNFTFAVNLDILQAKATAELEEPTLAPLPLAHRNVTKVTGPPPHRSTTPVIARFLGDWLSTLRLSQQRSPASSDPDH